MVCDMCFETELSDKLNNELEAAGISVSEALIAKTLAAVQAARTAEADSSEAEWVEVAEENANKLIELAGTRRRSLKRVAPVLFRVATVMAACFVLVVGAFALRFSTMRMGKDSAAPMTEEESTGARGGIMPDAVADSDVADGFVCYSETSESLSEVPMDAVENSANETVVSTAESDVADDADAVTVVSEETEISEVQNAAVVLTELLERAESVEKELTAQGKSVYRFMVRDAATAMCYLVHEDGRVEYAELMANGETGAVLLYEGADGKAFQRAVLVWMKQNGY